MKTASHSPMVHRLRYPEVRLWEFAGECRATRRKVAAESHPQALYESLSDRLNDLRYCDSTH
jgi:hypothetical protein